MWNFVLLLYLQFFEVFVSLPVRPVAILFAVPVPEEKKEAEVQKNRPAFEDGDDEEDDGPFLSKWRPVK
jgi:hypothetical protein